MMLVSSVISRGVGVAVLVALSGCAAKVLSSSPRTVVVNAGSVEAGKAQVAADAECKRHSKLARLASKPSPNQYIYDCID
jgi:hypothetical protein